MLIAQLSDLHIVPEGQLCQNKVETHRHLRNAVAHINSLTPKPDAILVTGDLADYGSPEEYQLIRSILNDLASPFFIVPGNHDRRTNLLAEFSDHPYLPAPESKHVLFTIDDFQVRLIGLDTALFGEPYGRLCSTRLDWLDQTLTKAPETPTIIFMHHPPFRTGIRWIDAAGLYGGRKMEEIVARHPQIQRVLCGHVHRPIQVPWGGTLACTAPSSSHAQVTLSLNESSGYQFAYSMEPFAIQLFQWDSSYGLVNHTSYILSSETYAPGYAQELRERFRNAYRELCTQEYEFSSRSRQ